MLELFVLPIDFFTFRFYETLNVEYFTSWLNGPFYPNMHLEKIEEGDLSHNTPFAIKRKIITDTDKFGFRKKNTEKKADVVIIGDSFIWGSNLSQDEMLSETLERKINKTVYPYAQAEINDYIMDERFIQNPPKTVILERIERSIYSLPELNQQLLNDPKQLGLQTMAMYCDRLMSSRMFSYYKSRFNHIIQKAKPQNVDSVLFLNGIRAFKEASTLELIATANVIEGYRDFFKKKNIDFIFLPIPNKENIYYKLFPAAKKYNNLQRLIEILKKRNVRVIDTQSAFETAYGQRGQTLYHRDDTHWNYKGVELTVNLIADSLEK